MKKELSFIFVFILFLSSVSAIDYVIDWDEFDDFYKNTSFLSTTYPFSAKNITGRVLLGTTSDGINCYMSKLSYEYSSTWSPRRNISIGDYVSNFSTKELLLDVPQPFLSYSFDSPVLYCDFPTIIYALNGSSPSRVVTNTRTKNLGYRASFEMTFVSPVRSCVSTFYADVLNDYVTYCDDYVSNFDTYGSVGFVNSTVNNHVINFKDMSNVNRYYPIKAFILNVQPRYTGGATDLADTVYFDDIYFYDFTDEANNFPYVNVTFETDTCFNESLGLQNIVYTVDSYDVEGDTIYYAIEYFSGKNYNETVDYNNYACDFLGVCFAEPNYLFLDNVVYNNDSCLIESTGNIDNSKHNLVEYKVTSGDNKYLLQLNGACSGSDKEYLYKLDKGVSNLFYGTEWYGLKSDGEKVNFTFYNNDLTQKLMNIKFEVNGTRLYFVDNLDGSLIGNVSADRSKIDFSLNTFFNATNTSYMLLFGEDSGLYNFSTVNSSESLVKYIGMTVYSGTVMYLDRFTLSGIFSSPNWVTSLPNNINVTNDGIYQIKVYYTDEVALENGVYDSDIYYYNSISCDYKIPEVLDQDSLELSEAVKSSFTKLCTGFDQAKMGKSGLQIDNDKFSLCSVIEWFVFGFAVLMAVVVVVVFNFFAPHMSFAFGLITYGLFMLVGDIWIIELNNNLELVSILLFVIGIVMVILSLIRNDTGGVASG